MDITSDDIDRWAQQISAESTLPTLVRRLLLATAAVERISVRSDGGTRIAGWDGITVLRGGTAHAPAGTSGWEMTVQKTKRKFDDDFEKRSADHRAGVEPCVDVYVAVTARRCGIKSKWEAEKRAAGPWKDVRLLDADDLATWLGTAPAVSAWFAALLGKPIADVVDLPTFAHRWSARTARALPETLVLAGKDRTALADQLRGWARANRTGVHYVQGETREEATLFIAAALSTPECTNLAARALILDTPEAWRWASTAQTAAPLILVPSFRHFDPGAAATAGALVVVPVGPEVALLKSRALVLPRLPHEPLSAVLVEHGWGNEEAKRLTRESGGKLAALQLLCGPIDRPAWVASIEPPEANALLLAGAWVPTNKADAKVIEALGSDPAKAESACTALYGVEGRPMEAVHDGLGPRHWRWAAEGQTWSTLAPGLTEASLAAFRQVVVEVLGADDPQYSMPMDRRFYAGVEGKVLEQSDELREGLARSLVRLSLADDSLAASLGAHRGSGTARPLVRQILGTEWRRWASLSPLLPTLAEAAPHEFLDQVERSLLTGDAGVIHLFSEESTFGSAPHTGLLWALEALAWNPKLSSRVAQVLARLAVADPPGEGKLVNRPLRSLRDLLHPFVPQSASSAEERTKMLAAIAKIDAAIAWKVLLEPYDGLGNFVSASYRPRIVDWNLPAPLAHAGPSEIILQTAYSIDLMLSLAADHAERLGELFRLSRHLPAEDEARIIDAVAAIPPVRSTADPQSVLWRTLRQELYLYHLAGARAGSKERLARTEALYAALTPTDLARELAWLFDLGAGIPEDCAGDLTRSERRRAELQDEAIARVRAAPAGIETLARICDLASPELVGAALARSEWALEILPALMGPIGRMLPKAVPGLLAVSSDRRGLDWLRGVLGDLLGAGHEGVVVQTLLLLPARGSTWDLVSALGATVRAEYWSRLQGAWGSRTAAEHERAIAEFLAAGRIGCALQTACHAKDDLTPNTALRVLEAVRAGDHASIAREAGANMLGYYLTKVFERADRSGNDAAVAQLELFFFEALKDSTRPPRHIYDGLKSQPDLFVHMLCWIFRSREEAATTGEGPTSDAPAEDVSPEKTSSADVARAQACYRIMHAWKGYPGEDAPAADRERLLTEWTQRVLALATERGRGVPAVSEVGAVLARAPADIDGIWPCRTVREMLADGRHPNLRVAIEIAEQNRLGHSTRHHLAGGDRERELAKGYRQGADKIRGDWPATAAMLDELAGAYDHDAQRHDDAVAADRVRYGE